MKIIKWGEIPEEKPMRFQCMRCKTIFEAERNERELVFDQRDGNFWKSNCPVCLQMATKAAR